MELHPVASGLVAAFGEDLEGFLGYVLQSAHNSVYYTLLRRCMQDVPVDRECLEICP